jgi:hypothetical protein
VGVVSFEGAEEGVRDGVGGGEGERRGRVEVFDRSLVGIVGVSGSGWEYGVYRDLYLRLCTCLPMRRAAYRC